jgi:hypothetical protein
MSGPLTRPARAADPLAWRRRTLRRPAALFPAPGERREPHAKEALSS